MFRMNKALTRPPLPTSNLHHFLGFSVKMNQNIEEVIALMTAQVQSLKRSRPDDTDSSPVSSESPAKKKNKMAETPKDEQGKIVFNQEPNSKITSEPKHSCQKCSYVGTGSGHLKSHYFYHHLTDEVRTFYTHL
jgi:hypothetical protein